ncbi:MAG: hypothetical protein IPK82_03640 [Polyangiaceae bacterium]|nr:hypothetical protein [Polyangiaceae bacterium]
MVLRALRDGRHIEALQFNDYVVVQIDTDRCEDTGFNVPLRSPDGRPLELAELVEQVRLRLVRAMGTDFFNRHGHRVVFAIAVDSIECWLLPLLYDSEPIKKAKTTGCLDAANRKLNLSRSPTLSTADGQNKDLRAYERASRDYRKSKQLLAHRDENPSLALFLHELDRIRDSMSNSPTAHTAPNSGQPDA